MDNAVAVWLNLEPVLFQCVSFSPTVYRLPELLQDRGHASYLALTRLFRPGMDHRVVMATIDQLVAAYIAQYPDVIHRDPAESRPWVQRSMDSVQRSNFGSPSNCHHVLSGHI
ncbi:hypothetical protein KL921_003607 [Ogataea angusta]|nr:hypothetical protein KL921_003607 [Ogataea angusta]KAG7833137.1 hypothetical protein KL943_004002 [Ogataea angusta]KAG7857347.1 hypothetical protein KL919_003984 [Ogataea angusta]